MDCSILFMLITECLIEFLNFEMNYDQASIYGTSVYQYCFINQEFSI